MTTLLDRLTAHLDVATVLIGMLMLAAAYLAACGLVGAVGWARNHWYHARDDDAFGDVPTEVLGWPTDLGDGPCDCEDCANVAADFAAIAEQLAGDFQHIDIQRLTALYELPGRRD